MALRLLRGRDGRLTAFAAVPGGVTRWTETRPGGPEWTGPRVFETPGLDEVTVAQGRDGYIQLIGLRRKAAGAERTDVEVVHATQFQSGRAMTGWHSLGTPHPKDWRKAQRIGAPTAAVDGTGAAHVFVRNAGGGVSARSQNGKGAWGPWIDLKGRELVAGLTATATGEGRVELLAPAAEAVLRWYQPEPGGALRRAEDIPAAPRPGSVSAVESSRDTITHYWRDDPTGALLAWRAEGREPVPLGGRPGTGPVALAHAVVDGHDCTVLAQQDNRSGRLAVAAYPCEDEAAGVWWTETGEVGAAQPALALDGRGRVVLAALGPDGGLRVARQKTDEGG
ncbi:hypothetical protein, partial [Streptomyces palmae]